jgi:adenine-specific DNA-methyltransferase
VITKTGPRTRQRSLGAYYTPRSAADHLAAWAIRTGREQVLEPSMGDGAFIFAVREAGRLRGELPHITGVELSTETYAATMSSDNRADEGIRSDFLRVRPRPVDAVIGNPPFVRLRHLSTQERDAALQAGRSALGCELDPSGSVWLPFVAHAARFLKPGGRLALVLPLEATYVRYARPLWTYLAARFGTVRVIRVRQRIFSDIMQDVVLLQADDFGGTCSDVEFAGYATVADLLTDTPLVRDKIAISEIVAGARPFTRALLPPGAAELLSERVEPFAQPALERLKFNIGYVAGDKTFFHPTAAEVQRYGLSEESLRPTVASARRLAGGGLTTSGLSPEHQDRLFLPVGDLSDDEMRYVQHGEKAGVAAKYKCRIREPWYSVPGVKTPDLILTVFSDRPALLINDAGYAASNSLLCGYLRAGQSAAAFAAAWYTPLTLLSIELVVHSLGGGVLILVPKEADAVRMAPIRQPAEARLKKVDAALRARDPLGAYKLGEQALRKSLGLSIAEVQCISDARHALSAWRQPAS